MSRVYKGTQYRDRFSHDWAHLFSVSCPILGAPSNGNLTQTTDGVTTSIQFSCDTGFSLSGEATLACLDTGSWNGTSPTCGEFDLKMVM